MAASSSGTTRRATITTTALHHYRGRNFAWLTRGNRRVRYRGVAKNDHWLHHRAAALNLRRLLALGLTTDHNGWALA